MAVSETMSFGFDNHKERLNKNSQFFTKKGWNSFYSALTNARIIEMINANNQTINTGPTGTPIIIQKDTIDNVHTWYVEIPSALQYSKGARTRTDYQNITLEIKRTNETSSPAGIAIERWIALLDEKGDKKYCLSELSPQQEITTKVYNNKNSKLEEPIYDDLLIGTWASLAITDALSFDDTSLEEENENKHRLKKISHNFTEDGWASFLKILEKQRIVEMVEQLTAIHHTSAKEAAYLRNKGIVSGSYQWTYDIPVVIAHQSPKQKWGMNMDITIVIKRTNDKHSNQEIAIDNITAIEGSGQTLPCPGSSISQDKLKNHYEEIHALPDELINAWRLYNKQ